MNQYKQDRGHVLEEGLFYVKGKWLFDVEIILRNTTGDGFITSALETDKGTFRTYKFKISRSGVKFSESSS